MTVARQLHLLEAKGVKPTRENVEALVDEIWALQAKVASARTKAYIDMRDAAVAKYKEFCQRDSFTDDDVIEALSSIPIPD